MKYTFRLATMLKIRENSRTEAQTVLARAVEAQQIIEDKITELQAELASLLNESRQGMTGGHIRVDFLIGLRRHEAVLLAQKQTATEQLEVVKQEVERRRTALMEADREVKILEKLQEKQRTEFVTNLQKMDTKQMDEIAGAGPRRKSGGIWVN